jgi:hypothetical protein
MMLVEPEAFSIKILFRNAYAWFLIFYVAYSHGLFAAPSTALDCGRNEASYRNTDSSWKMCLGLPTVVSTGFKAALHSPQS